MKRVLSGLISLQQISVSVDFEFTAVVVTLQSYNVGETPNGAVVVFPANDKRG